MRKNNKKKGFTIVELVIVIAVIAILAGVLIPTFANVVKKAQESAALQEAQSLYKEAMALDLADGTLDGKKGKDATENITNVEGKEVTYKAADEKVTSFVYTATNGYTATYENGAWTVSDEKPAGDNETPENGEDK